MVGDMKVDEITIFRGKFYKFTTQPIGPIIVLVKSESGETEEKLMMHRSPTKIEQIHSQEQFVLL
jgi:hypothetical protein